MNKVIKRALAGVAAFGIAASGLVLGGASAYAANTDPQTGTITITDAKTDHTFSGWHLATVTDVEWNNEAHEKVTGFQVDTDNKHVADIEAAMKDVSDKGTSLYDTYRTDKNFFLGEGNENNNPMGWFTTNYKDHQEVSSPWGGGGKEGAQSVLRAFAQALSKRVKAEKADKTDFVADDKNTPNKDVTQGLWFLKDTTATTDDTAAKETNSIPIITPTTLEGMTGWGSIAIKNTTPTIDKKLVDADANGGYTANTQPDYAVGDTVSYELTSTIPVFTGYDIDTTMKDDAKTRVFKITDTADKALTVEEKSVIDSVKVGTTTLKPGVDYDVTVVAYAGTDANYTGGHVTTIDLGKYVNKFAGSISATEGIDEGATVTVIVKAKLNGNAKISEPGKLQENLNTVDLTYSNKPEDVQNAHKVPGPTVPVYSYKFGIKKTDKGGDKVLEGAKFTIKVVSDTSNHDGKYLGAYDATNGWTSYLDSEPGENAQAGVFSSGKDGMINVSGLDAGTYEVHEIAAPKDYTSLGLPKFTFTIQPTMGNETNGHKTITAESFTVVQNAYVSIDDGVKTQLNIWNAKNITELPKTGGAGLAMIVTVGVLFIAAAGAFGIRARRNA